MYCFILSDLAKWWTKLYQLAGRMTEDHFSDGLLYKNREGKVVPVMKPLFEDFCRSYWDMSAWQKGGAFSALGGWEEVMKKVTRLDDYPVMHVDDDGNHLWWGDHVLPAPGAVTTALEVSMDRVSDALIFVRDAVVHHKMEVADLGVS